MLQTHCICLGVLFFRLSPTPNQLWFGTVGRLCSASRLSESQLSPRKDGLSRSGLNILSMGVRMEKFPFQLLSCSESEGIKLRILPTHREASFTGKCEGKRESPALFLPQQQRGPLSGTATRSFPVLGDTSRVAGKESRIRQPCWDMAVLQRAGRDDTQPCLGEDAPDSSWSSRAGSAGRDKCFLQGWRLPDAFWRTSAMEREHSQHLPPAWSRYSSSRWLRLGNLAGKTRAQIHVPFEVSDETNALFQEQDYISMGSFLLIL